MSNDLHDLLAHAADGAGRTELDLPTMVRGVRRRRRTRAAVTVGVTAVVVGALATTAVATGTRLRTDPLPPASPSPTTTTTNPLPAPDPTATPGACGSVIEPTTLTGEANGLEAAVFAGEAGGRDDEGHGDISVGMTTVSHTQDDVTAQLGTATAVLLRDDVVVARAELRRAQEWPTVNQFDRTPWALGDLGTVSCSSGATLPDGDYVLAAVEDVTTDAGTERLVTGGQQVSLRDGLQLDACDLGLPEGTDPAALGSGTPLELTSNLTDEPDVLGVDAEIPTWTLRWPDGTDAGDREADGGLMGDVQLYAVDDEGLVVAHSREGTSVDPTMIGDSVSGWRSLRPCTGDAKLPAEPLDVVAVIPYRLWGEAGVRTDVRSLGEVDGG
ncbi:hypothetical protein [Cellulomonas sp. HZM]|uniref:hypothetical protein n=1 Tax=Cellulomonas sp. HZM TaxID=1454010 RepID=UPI000493548F|nr:hypothetical protein [Cellulomonas sp. HZM]